MPDQLETSSTPIIGRSPRIRQILRLVEKVGQNRWPVLLLGETGTGKEVIARAIHRANPQGPFVTIDCASLVGPLMESELFGHAKGSFTGAVNSKLGLIELANGGTAFFDEIGELPLDLQSKLLRVVQQKEFRPVGSLAQRKADFRIIAATNRDLAQEVERGRFRQDLYYRLSVVNLRIAPLRDRMEDIPPLIEHFLERYGRNHVLTQEVVDTLLSYDWPGNVRELENCIQHLVALNSGPLVHIADLPSSLRNDFTQKRSQCAIAAAVMGPSGLPPASPAPLRHPLPADPNSPIAPLAEVERRAIVEALEYTRGDRAVAAQLLGIGRTTLYRKLKEYRLADVE